MGTQSIMDRFNNINISINRRYDTYTKEVLKLKKFTIALDVTALACFLALVVCTLLSGTITATGYWCLLLVAVINGCSNLIRDIMEYKNAKN